MSYTNGLDNPELYFQTKLHSGTGGGGGSLTFDGSENMQADMVWSKSRTEALNHTLFDSVRGAGSNKELTPNGTSPEGGADSAGFGYISAFNSNGFTWTAGGTNTENFNKSSQTYVHWNWKAGTSFTNDASATSVGTIDSSGSASDSSGFSIVSYTGTGSSGTIKHGLSSAPTTIFIKVRSHSDSWTVGHNSLGWGKYLRLDNTSAEGSNTNIFNNTTPTSTVFSVNHDDVNASGRTYIAYCFAEKKGYSKFGSYTGNGTQADGTFIYTGMKPSFVMLKRTDSTGNWNIYDNKRGAETYNPVTYRSFANENNTDASSSVQSLTFLSNGFKLYSNNTDQAASGGTYIYMCFAEAPFVNSNGIPTTAR